MTGDYDASVEDWREKEPDPNWIIQIRSLEMEFSQSVILDAGCGAGKFVRELTCMGATVYGVERDAWCLGAARRNNPGWSRFIRGDLCALPVSSRSIGVVLIRHVIHQIAPLEWNQVFSEALRVLQSRGKLLLETTYREEALDHFNSRLYEPLREIMLGLYPERTALLQALRQTGFLIEGESDFTRKRGAAITTAAALEDSRRLVQDGRGPTAWLRLTPREREEFHARREAALPRLFPSGQVPRYWPATMIVATKADV